MKDVIEAVLAEYVRPVLARHGGDISLSGFTDGIAAIRLSGQCAQCLASQETLQNLIRKELLSRVPGLKEVVLDESVPADMLNFARSLLHKI